jgi:hypothetical protein
VSPRAEEGARGSPDNDLRISQVIFYGKIKEDRDSGHDRAATGEHRQGVPGHHAQGQGPERGP